MTVTKTTEPKASRKKKNIRTNEAFSGKGGQFTLEVYRRSVELAKTTPDIFIKECPKELWTVAIFVDNSPLLWPCFTAHKKTAEKTANLYASSGILSALIGPLKICMDDAQVDVKYIES